MTTQPAAKVLQFPGQSHTIHVGAVSVSAQLAVGGGVTIAVWQGPSRHDAVTFSYVDKVLARRRYAQIRALASSGMTAEQIDAEVNGGGQYAVEQVEQILRDAMVAVARRAVQ